MIVYGGSFEEGWRKAVIEPFEKANPAIKVKIATGLTMQTVALMRAQKDDVRVDVIMMDEVGAAQANAEGLYYPLEVSKIANIEKLYPQFRTKGDPYTKFMYVAQALVYNKDAREGEADLVDGDVGSEVQRQDCLPRHHHLARSLFPTHGRRHERRRA